MRGALCGTLPTIGWLSLNSLPNRLFGSQDRLAVSGAR